MYKLNYLLKRYVMDYISHSDYTKMLKGFGKQESKGLIKEGLEKEGNAFTAGLAKTKKGGKFSVDGKELEDKSSYDASVNEYRFDQMYPDDPGPFEGYGRDEEWKKDPVKALDDFTAKLRHTRDTRKASRGASGSEDDLPFGSTPPGSNFELPNKPDDYDENPFSLDKGVDENLNSDPLQATGQTIMKKEGAAYNLSVLSPSERDQLAEYIKSMKTIKEEINKLVGKAKGVDEGGDNTNLVMKERSARQQAAGDQFNR